jgi:glycosyltransferase involved in cell wall biosynthesis
MRCADVMGSTSRCHPGVDHHGENGLLFDPGNIPGVAAALSQLAVDRKRLHAMGRSAFERAQSQPSWQASMGQVEAFARRMAQH